MTIGGFQFAATASMAVTDADGNSVVNDPEEEDDDDRRSGGSQGE